MKKSILYIAALLINICLFTFSSCSNDDDVNVAKPTVDLEEVGMEDCKEVMAGTDLHIEAEVLAEGLIKSINIEFTQKGGNYSFNQSYTEGVYINVKNTTFHEHIDIPQAAPAGAYTVKFSVTDKNNNTTTKESDLNITKYDANHPTVDMVNVGTNNDKTGILGGTINIAAKIKALNGIDEIEIEFHNVDTDKEYPLDIDGYEGETEVDFNKDIKIPAECTAGTYHIHFTVTDKKGEYVTAENEGVKLNNK